MAKEKFETILAKLEKIVEKLESGDLALEDALTEFKVGVDLIQKGTAKLNEMEGKVEKLLKDMKEEATVPFDDDDNNTDNNGELPF